MNRKTRSSLFTGLGFAIGASGIAASVGAAPADAKQDLQSTNPDRASHVLQSDSREFEVSFLAVPAGCKVDTAGFDAVEVAVREIPSEVRAVHAQIEAA